MTFCSVTSSRSIILSNSTQTTVSETTQDQLLPDMVRHRQLLMCLFWANIPWCMGLIQSNVISGGCTELKVNPKFVGLIFKCSTNRPILLLTDNWNENLRFLWPNLQTYKFDDCYKSKYKIIPYALPIPFSGNVTLYKIVKPNTDQFLPRDASAERGDATVSCPSVRPSVRNDQVPWPHTLEFFENNFTAK